MQIQCNNARARVGRPRKIIDKKIAALLRVKIEKSGIEKRKIAELCGLSRVSVRLQLNGSVTASTRLVDCVCRVYDALTEIERQFSQ